MFYIVYKVNITDMQKFFWGYGGTGRRAALRMLWRNPWEFESPYPHHEFSKMFEVY